MSALLDFSGRERSEKVIRDTWEEFRTALANSTFDICDTECALSTTFLRAFNDLFEVNNGKRYFKKNLSDVFLPTNEVVRGVRIKDQGSIPDLNRFIPDKRYIKEDNRFSPPGEEWLYLAIGPQKDAEDTFSIAELGSMAECHAETGKRFAVCPFVLNEKIVDNEIVDLTIALEYEYDGLNYELERAGEKYVGTGKREVLKEGCINPRTKLSLVDAIQRWAIYTYAKLMTEQLFVPVTTEDKRLVYAPFQCMAQYFKSLGYAGIMYSSTVFPSAKNIALFDKEMAVPTRPIKELIVP